MKHKKRNDSSSKPTQKCEANLSPEMLANLQRARALPRPKRTGPKSWSQLRKEELIAKGYQFEGNTLVCKENDDEIIDADASDDSNEESSQQKKRS